MHRHQLWKSFAALYTSTFFVFYSPAAVAGNAFGGYGGLLQGIATHAFNWITINRTDFWVHIASVPGLVDAVELSN